MANNASKYVVSILFFLLLSTHWICGQDSLSTLQRHWTDLKNQLEKRADIATDLVMIIRKSEKPDTSLIESIRLISADFRHFIATFKNPDSILVQLIYKKNADLTGTFSKALAYLISNKNLVKDEEAQELQMRLELSENRIRTIRKSYNDACVKYKRTDIVFGSTQAKKANTIEQD